MSDTLTREKVEQLAPDQASLSAALKLMKPASWPLLARSGDGSLIWAECQGSGATPYRIIVSPADVGYKCTCPSRKLPCKHVLAVMWIACESPQRFEQGPPPDWVGDWLARRRPKAKGSERKPDTAGGGSIVAAIAEADAAAIAEKTTDPKAAARAEAQRQRLREAREASMRDGLDELDRWIVDQLNLGLAGFTQRAAQSTKTLSTRLVDAKAPGLANRLDALAADVFRVPEPMRGDLVLERLAALALISAAYRRQEKLPAPLIEDVRRATGWTARREDLIADASAPRATADWIVAATRSEVQPDKLRRLETWLLNASAARPRVALLIDFVPVSSGPSTSPFIAGEALAGEVVFYPSALPLRAQLARRTPLSSNPPWPSLPGGLAAALTEYESALARQPWLESWPLAARSLRVVELASGQLALADASGLTLALDRAQTDDLTPMLRLEPLSALWIWDGRFATLLAADTPVGRWHETS
jgi:hypothetical protein